MDTIHTHIYIYIYIYHYYLRGRQHEFKSLGCITRYLFIIYYAVATAEVVITIILDGRGLSHPKSHRLQSD